MNVTAAGIDLIRRFEGCRLVVYYDPVRLSTVGFGHRTSLKVGQRITQAQADQWLAGDVEDVACRLRPLIDPPLSDNQFSAIASFAFNCGVGAFAKSTIRDAVNAKRFDEVPARLMLWTKAKGKELPGLVARRRAEGELWQCA